MMISENSPPEKRMKLEEVQWEKKNNNLISKVNKSLYLDEKTADVFFVCGAGDDRERIPAHKNILSKSSPVFDAMFYGPYKEEPERDRDYCKWSPDAFKEFLKLCYFDELVIDPKNIIEVIELAHESEMFESLQLCGELWADNMTNEDVCCAYHWAIRLEIDELKEFCERKISANPQKVFETADFLSCDRVVLNGILELETLLCDEKAVLQASLNWASKACERSGLNANEMANLRQYLQDSLYKIRYSSMTPKEFREVMDSKDGHFFDIEDHEDIIRLTTGAIELRTNRFNPKPRSAEIEWKENSALEWNLFNRRFLFRVTVINGGTQQVTLKTNRPILLGGIQCAPFAYDSSATVTFTQKSLTPKIVHTAVIELKRSNPYIDLTNSPIVIRPEFDYEISFKFQISHSAVYFIASAYDENMKIYGKIDGKLDGKTPSSSQNSDTALFENLSLINFETNQYHFRV